MDRRPDYWSLCARGLIDEGQRSLFAFVGYLPEQVLKDSQQPIQVLRGRSHSNSISTSEYADNEDGNASSGLIFLQKTGWTWISNQVFGILSFSLCFFFKPVSNRSTECTLSSGGHNDLLAELAGLTISSTGAPYKLGQHFKAESVHTPRIPHARARIMVMINHLCAYYRLFYIFSDWICLQSSGLFS